ncbi:cupin domain-containing protein [Paenarthrobacter sp. NPDC058040]|uniref:cupin domain-containing protein n=1 Tax=unclassified Paenarthrobacter TaxID=2634190 RepID=UPI0036DD4041
MTTMTVIRGSEIHSELAPAGQRPGADSGDPQLGLLKFGDNAPGSIGVWECEPGGWPVNDRSDTEVAYILAGSANITDSQTGVAHTVAAGDVIVLPPGWSGRWDVTETIRKVFVNY